MSIPKPKNISNIILPVLLIYFILISNISSGQSNLCERSQPFYTSVSVTYPATTDAGDAQSGPDYGCLGTQPNPAWFHMRISVAGDINIHMYTTPNDPNYDIDFICWGPFTDPFSPCTAELTGSKIIDCSYSPSQDENCYIPNGQVGEYYILMITNFINLPCDITFEKTFGSGETDPSIVPPVISNNGPLCVGETLELYAETMVDVTYSWTGPNGFTSSLQNPTISNVTLANAGVYSLVVYDINGIPSSPITMTVEIVEYPDVDFTIDLTGHICRGETITFTGSDASGTTITDWDWDYGDGNSNTGQVTTHSYNSDGVFTTSLTATNNVGCASSVSNNIIISPNVIVTAGSDESVCSNEPFDFSTSTALPDTTYCDSVVWSGGTGSFNDPRLLYPVYTPGVGETSPVTLTLTAYGFCGTESSTMLLTLESLPDVSFNILPNDTICINELADFSGTNNGTSTIQNWQWDFGDGGTSSGQNPTHSYSSVYNGDVQLIATNNQNCSDTVYGPITVVDPVIDFNFTPNPSCVGTDLDFTGTGDANFTEWIWDFGDGNTATGYNVTHTYATDGTFNISLSVCSKTANDQATVNPGAYCDAGSDESYCDQVPFNFANSSVPPIATGYDSIRWFGGLGTFSDVHAIQPIYTPATGEEGVITLSMVAYGIAPCGNDTSTVNLTIGTLPDPSFVFNPTTEICVNDAVSFNGSNNNSTTITNWDWDFGDGNTSTNQNTNHAFAADGTYDVELSLTTSMGCVEVTNQQITINEIPDASISVGPSNITCQEAILNFSGTDNNATNITSWEWDFGDGNTATGQNTSHSYQNSGTYTVSLNLTNSDNCISSVTTTVVVRTLPVSDFTISPNDTSCLGETINFDALNISGDIVSWDWEFGDATTATGQNVSHIYNQEGNFDILSIYTNADGCVDTTIYQRNVQDVNIGFDITQSPTCQDFIVDFTGTGDLVTFTDWIWDFGDGSPTEIGQNLTHTYSLPDTLTVSLNVCSEHSDQQLIINTPCSVDAGSDGATCEDVYYKFSESTTPPSATNYTSIEWFTDGLGTFDDNTLIAPTYFPDDNEGSIQNDTLTFTMVGYAVAPCNNDTSTMKLIVIPGAYAQAGSDENSCFNEPYDFANSTDSSFATNYTNIYWLTSGTGSFVDPNVEQPIYIPGNGEIGPITLTMVASNIISCDSIDEMILTIRPVFETNLDTTVCFIDSVFLQGDWQHNSGIYYDTLSSIYNCDSVIITDLTVLPEINQSFTIDTPDSICYGETVNFTSFGSSNITSRTWDFGDGYLANSQNPSHQYDSSGVFTVIYYFEDDNNCHDSLTREITVFKQTDATFTSSTNNACINTEIEFMGSTDPSIISWDWDFGDGLTGTGQHITHIYNSWGNLDVMLTTYDTNGCSESTVQTFVIAQPPIANFTYDIIICDSIQFTDLSTSAAGYNMVTWYWDFGDGSYSDLQNPTHQYPHTTTPGGEIYNVSLIVQADSNGFVCSDSIVLPVVVPESPDIFYTFDPDPTCFGDTTFFFGESGYPITSWLWDFDDGNFADSQYPNHIFADTGSYNVELNIVDNNGCVNNLAKIVRVNPIPEVSIDVDNSTICNGNVVSFMGSGSSNAMEWYWDFDDGTFSYEQNPVHYFTSGGTYSVTLTLTDSTFCSNSTSIDVLVLPSPTADFSFVDVVCNTFDFTDLSAAPAGYNLILFQWDFDDGTTSDLQNPTHSFATGGPHLVTLVVTADSAGYSCNDTISQTVVSPEPPTVFFSWDPEPTTLGDPTSFFGTSGNTIAEWYWDFGDGNFATTQNTTHTYAFMGTFDVTLTVKDIGGCINSITHQVHVGNIPDLDFYWDNACMGDPLQFYISVPPTDTAAVVSWQWDFDDGGMSSVMEPLHVFNIDGTYQVSLTITDTMGISNSIVKSVVVNPLPIALFSIDAPTCENNPVQFYDYSSTTTGYITTWFWDFGDGSDTTVFFPGNPDVSHIYNNAGPFEVTLIVTNSDSCSNSYSATATTIASPMALFNYTSGCANAFVEFEDASVDNGGGDIISWYWDFGDPASGVNNTSNMQNPTHQFSSFGVYDVTLTITSVNGCTSSITTQITVDLEPALDFLFTNACLGAETLFEADPDVTNISEIESYLWNFGDGSTSVLPEPSHIYASTGDFVVTLSIVTTNGCTASISHTVSINPLPNPNFAHTSPACMGEAIDFIDLSSSVNGSIISWYWDFGDGNTTTIIAPDNPDVSHIYSISGTFDVSLTVKDSDSCENTIVKQVVVLTSPIANFTFDEQCYGDPVLFTDISSTNGGTDLYSWQWFFGDPLSGINNNANIQNPSHIFTNPGSYNVTLVIENTMGCSDTIIKEVVVDSLPDVDFTMASDTICLDQMAQFTGIAQNVNSWYWEFGDGGTAIVQNPEYLYAAPGSYNVTLTIVGADGCQNSISKTIVVNQLPSANFSYQTPLCASSQVQFIDQSSTPLGTLVEWTWDFGDGNTTTILAPDDPNVTHAYTLPGTYNVTLIVMNSDSCIDEVVNDIVIIPSPTADFSFTDGCFGQAIMFTDMSSANGGNIISWDWNFGDPGSGALNTSSSQNPSHVFSASGDFDVTLIIADINGCGDTITQTVTMTDPADVEFDFTAACLGMPTQFTVDETITDITNVESFDWNFGDGGTSSSQNPEHTYASMGTYQVTLTITTLQGCIASVVHDVTINPLPNANFENTSPACLNDTIYFTDLSTSPNGNIVTWFWDFGDGNTTTINFPDIPDVGHLYLNDAIYDVSLTITDSEGCENTVVKQVQVLASPIADFNYEETCFGDPVIFTDMSSANGGVDINSWEWFFGDANSGVNNHSNLQNPTHIFSIPDSTYTTTLIVVNTMGCTDTVQYEITVDSLPFVDFNIVNDSICLGEAAEFNGIGNNISTWFWEFGDGGVAIDQNPSYMYAAPGIYTVTLTVTEIGGDQCQNSISYEVYVNDAPMANFSYQNNCLGDSTYFTDLSYSNLGFVDAWLWDFGDGNTSDLQNPAHLYTVNDSYLVTLITFDNFGCSDTISQWIQIFDSPVPGFSFDQVCDPEGQVNFFDESVVGDDNSPIISWNWNLDEGYYSTEIDPSYIYPATDSCYTVILEITDANGCVAVDTNDQVCLHGTIQVDFSATEECLGVPTFFEATYSPENDSVAAYSWNFNDGSPIISTYHDTISHVFPNPGTYIVELMALDTNGCSTNVFNEITVDSLPTARFTNTIGNCTMPTQFTDISLGGGEFIESWYWDFGDITSGADNFSTLQNPSHLYGPHDSTYLVKLIVTNFNGCIDSVVQEVMVDPCLMADFELPQEPVCARFEVCFADSSNVDSNNGNIIEWLWDFGDGNSYSYTNMQNPICHTYDDFGDFDVQLVILANINGIQYSDTLVRVLTVNPTPIAQIDVENNCLNDSTFFFDNSTDFGEPVNFWHWDFGDESSNIDTAIIKNPAYLYPDYNTYQTELIVMNQFGCRDSIIQPVTVFKPPVAEFAIDETCMTYYTYFMDESIADSADIAYYLWNFGDTLTIADTSNLQNPQYIYDTTGFYNIKLRIVDQNMCWDTISHQVEIYPIPTSGFNIFDTIQQGNIYLENTSSQASDYYWDFDFDYGVSTTEVNPFHQYEVDGNYNIMLIAYNNYGCPDTTFKLYELLFTNLFVPNAFVPSSSNPELNVFKPVGINLATYQIDVYSAWGNKVFSSTLLDEHGSPKEGWDGNYQGQPMPTGSYIWKISATFVNGDFWKGTDNGDGNVNTSGTITLIR